MTAIFHRLSIVALLNSPFPQPDLASQSCSTNTRPHSRPARPFSRFLFLRYLSPQLNTGPASSGSTPLPPFGKKKAQNHRPLSLSPKFSPPPCAPPLLP